MFGVQFTKITYKKKVTMPHDFAVLNVVMAECDVTGRKSAEF